MSSTADEMEISTRMQMLKNLLPEPRNSHLILIPGVCREMLIAFLVSTELAKSSQLPCASQLDSFKCKKPKAVIEVENS